MTALVRLLVRLALLAWPRRRRRAMESEAVDASVRGFHKRRTWARSSAWMYVVRVLADLIRAGVRERSRDGSGRTVAAAGETLARDLALALRRLRTSPGTTMAAVGIIALGVGVAAGAYAALEAIVLSTPPLPGADELGLVRRRAVSGPDTAWSRWSYPELRDLRESTRGLFRNVAGYTVRRARVSGAGDPEYVSYELVTPGYFETLALAPVLGRAFTPEEEGVDAAPGVVILSHGLWTTRFGGDPAALGREVRLAGSPLRIVGVAPPGFGGLTGDASLWVPVGQSRPNMGSWGMERRDVAWLEVVARRREEPGGGALAERLARIGAAVEAVEPRGGTGERIGAAFVPLGDLWLPDATRDAAWMAMASALAILAIVVINLFALLLVRERRRAASTAVQMALGAGRGTVVRERMVESVALALVGGAAGIALAAAGIRTLGALWPDHVFRASAGYLRLFDASAVELDVPVLLAGVLVAALTSLVAHVGPAVLRRGPDLASTLKLGAPGSRSRGPGGLGGWLLGAQIAVTLVLLVTSGLLGGSLRALLSRQRGFDPHGFLALSYDLVGRPAMRSPEATRTFHEELRRRLEALPGVTAVSMSSSPPLGSGFIASALDQVDGGPAFEEGAGPEMGVHVVDHAYFETLGTPLLRGRTFTEAETSHADPVVVLTERAVRSFFGGDDPLGRRIRFRMNSADPSTWWTVVGVVDDILYRSPVEGLRPEVFVPLGVWAPIGLHALIRAEGPVEPVLAGARTALLEVDPQMAYSRTVTGAQLRAEDVAFERALAAVVVVFTTLALLLSVAGLWASVAQMVGERRREIGVRLAVGASRGSVQRLFVRRRLVPVGVGALLGLVAASVASERMADTLFGIEPQDPRIYAASAILLVLVCVLAAWIPARAVTRVDPVRALRT